MHSVRRLHSLSQGRNDRVLFGGMVEWRASSVRDISCGPPFKLDDARVPTVWRYLYVRRLLEALHQCPSSPPLLPFVKVHASLLPAGVQRKLHLIPRVAYLASTTARASHVPVDGRTPSCVLSLISRSHAHQASPYRYAGRHCDPPGYMVSFHLQLKAESALLAALLSRVLGKELSQQDIHQRSHRSPHPTHHAQSD
jgi:hypothetical protein